MKKIDEELEELVLLLANAKLSRSAVLLTGTCSVCGHPNVRIVRWRLDEGDSIEFCLPCSLLVMTNDLFARSWGMPKSVASGPAFDVDGYLAERRKVESKLHSTIPIGAGGPPSFLPPEFFDPPSPEVLREFIEGLKKSYPKFAVRLSGFLVGDVKMDDGTQHPLLDSIAKQVVEKRRMPTKKQELAFIGIFDGLVARKAAGLPLKMESEDERRKRANVSSRLVAIARRNITKWPGAKTREIISSMAEHFDKHGSLTEKQIGYLRFIVEQLPASELAKD